MLKASALVEFCKSMVGMPYWYGTCVYNCTESKLQSKAKQYPAHYGNSRMSKYRDAIKKKLVCMDCVGMIKGFFWTNGGVGVKDAIGTGKSIINKYASNGCPDKSADGMLRWCKSQGAQYGKIAALPEVPGVLLFSSGHVGVYIGGGYAVEARGFNYGVVQTIVVSRKWETWAYMPSSVLEYDTAGNVTDNSDKSGSGAAEKVYALGDRIIKRGVKGDDVVELQTALLKLGYDLGAYGADGDCGSKTVSAIKNFQKDNGLSDDGEYGPKSHAKMMEILSASNSSATTSSFKIEVTGDSVNVRAKPSTATGKVMYVAHAGDVLIAIEVDTATGWYKLTDGNYISNKYSKMIK